MSLRIARQTNLPLVQLASNLKDDPSPQVRREVLITLRFESGVGADTIWAELARKHDGRDRWCLEALGVAADLHWEGRFSAWLKLVGDNWDTPGGRDIIWRSRSKQALRCSPKFSWMKIHPRISNLVTYVRLIITMVPRRMLH